MTREEWIGTVTRYYPRAHAAAVHLDLGELHLGDHIRVEAPEFKLRLEVQSMEIDREPVEGARAGQEVGIKVPEPIPKDAHVYLERRP